MVYLSKLSPFLLVMARRSVRVTVKRRGAYRRRSLRRRKFYGKRKAASQQKQRAHFLVKSTYTGFIRIDPISQYNIGTRQEYSSSNVGGSASLSVYRNLMKSNYFNNIRSMYDQVRVNSCKITIIPTQSVLATGVKQAIFVSAWDRNGVDQPTRPPGFSEIASHSSAFQKPLNLETTTWKATRKISISTLAEKSAWIPTGALVDQDGHGSGFERSSGQSYSMPWNPQLLIGILVSPSSANALPTSQTWGFVAQFEWSLTFRGLRYDLVHDDGAVQQVQAVINPAAAPSVGNTAVTFGNVQTTQNTATQGVDIPANFDIRIEDKTYSTYWIANWAISAPFQINLSGEFQNLNSNTVVVQNPIPQPGVYTTVVVFAYADQEVSGKKFRHLAVVGYNLQANEQFQFTISGAQSIRYRNLFVDEGVAYNTGFVLSYSVFTDPASIYNKAEVLTVAPKKTDKLFEKHYGRVLVSIDNN